MTYWKSLKFWTYYCGFWLVSLSFVAVMSGIFIDLNTSVVKALCIVGASLLLTSLLAWWLARDAVLWDRRYRLAQRDGRRVET